MRKISQLLSAMVYQNIVIIVAIGIIRAIFGDYGWWYNETIIEIVDPVYHTLLPVLIGYTGGKIIGGQRGAAVAAIAVFGLTLSSSLPVILGAMIVGPIAGWVIKKIDEIIIKKLPGVGYELLIGNLLAAIVAVIFTLLSFLYVGKMFSNVIEIGTDLLEYIIYSSSLPLVAIIIEPAKVLFFNNIINFGMLAPLGIQQANEIGKSIFFLLESNPGPGLGILLAYWIRTKAEQRKGAKIATSIHFLGGIHEVYFPYVLMKPRLVIALILGGVVGVITFQWFDVGLVSISSPGSIFLLIGLAPKGDMIFVFLGVLFSAFMSFIMGILLLRTVSETPTVEDTQETIVEFYQLDKNEQLPNRKNTKIVQTKLTENRNTVKEIVDPFTNIKEIYFVCEAGIGSSAMGAAMLRKKLQQANLYISVENSSMNEVPESADLIICHERLLPDIKNLLPNKSYYPLRTFTDMNVYDRLVEQLK
ncbi:PTS transporter subunit EIIC [Pseudogracilibacillus sp. SO30301A]|uniref:PTS transporter subunit EIIC n=1 Tax=Pseudogracilibacillus sp. SO30301A TaxID=3098291 RepID=UPI00300DD0EA